MNYETLKVTEENDVLVAVLNAPQRLNAMRPAMAGELADLFSAAGKRRAILLTGEGRAFSSGADLAPGAASGKDGEFEEDPSAALAAVYNPMVRAMRDCACPIVTAVNGPAAGIGCAVALMGDIVIAAQSAYFLQALRRVGLVPDGGTTFLLPRLVGKARAMELMLMGDRLAASQALDWGLINRCVPDDDLLANAMSIAHALAAGPASLKLIRRAVWASLDADWEQQLGNEQHAARIAVGTHDYQEGVLAFQEKRAPRFVGE